MQDTEKELKLYYSNLGKLIKKYRIAKGFTLEELGLLIGLDPSSVYNIEKGRNLTVLTLIKLAAALDRKPQDLLKIDFNFTKEDNDKLGKRKK